MKKRILSLMLVLCMVTTLFVALPITASALRSGIYTYTAANRQATITTCFSSVSGAIVIPSTLGDNLVTKIGYQAFAFRSNLTSVTIPSSVTTICADAFVGCDSLTDIYYTGSEEDWNRIFIDSPNSDLNNATIHYNTPEPIIYGYEVSNGQATITACPKSASGAIEIPSTINGYPVTTLGYQSFAFRSDITSITIPSSVTAIEYGSFFRCSGLTSIRIGSSVTFIGARVFDSCTSLTNIEVDDNNPNYKSYDGNLFSKGGKVLMQYAIGKTDQHYTIPNSVTSIGECAFSYCPALTSVTIPTSVTSIEKYAFQYCSALTSITIGSSVTAIGDYAFSYCSALTSIIIPNSVTTLGNDAFYKCEGLTNVTIGNSVTSIEEDAFQYCISLTNIEVDANNPNYKSYDGNLFSKDGKVLAKYATGKTNQHYTIPNSVTSIGNYTFYSCPGLTSVTIPTSVTFIGWYAFDGCDSFTDIYYTGSKDDWNKISIHSTNPALKNATIHYNVGEGSIYDVDKYIIEQVSKYTSNDMMLIIDTIASSNYTADVKFQALNEIFQNYGLTDAQEGVKFLSEASPHRMNYRYLTTDEIYCAYNFG
ncbi:MAG: leucine-rich repeat protein, partial [bacterium]|nr:leucine-rich repeat protein [bacterium]